MTQRASPIYNWAQNPLRPIIRAQALVWPMGNRHWIDAHLVISWKSTGMPIRYNLKIVSVTFMSKMTNNYDITRSCDHRGITRAKRVYYTLWPQQADEEFLQQHLFFHLQLNRFWASTFETSHGLLREPKLYNAKVWTWLGNSHSYEQKLGWTGMLLLDIAKLRYRIEIMWNHQHYWYLYLLACVFRDDGRRG